MSDRAVQPCKDKQVSVTNKCRVWMPDSRKWKVSC